MASQGAEVEKLIEQAERDLKGLDSGPFTPQAFLLLKIKVSDYVQALILESVRVAKRNRADAVSASHVERAGDHLVTNSSRRWVRHLGTVGGILLGAALSNFLAMASTAQYSTNGVVVSAVLAVIGAFGVAFHIGRE